MIALRTPPPVTVALFLAATAAAATSPRPSTSSSAKLAPTTAAQASRAPSSLVLVLPLTAKGESEPEYLSAGAAEYLAEALSAAGYSVLDADTREEAISDVGLADARRLTLASACELARRLNARYVVTGTWEGKDTRLAFKARFVDAQQLRMVRQGTGDGHVTTLPSVLAGVALANAGEGAKTGGPRKEIDRLSTLEQDVLMSWMQAAAEPDNAVKHLEAALAADPQFVPAQLDLAEARLDGGEPELVAGIVARIPSSAADHHRARARRLEGRALLALGDTRGALGALGDAIRLRADVEGLLWLAEAQLAAGDRPGAVATARRVLEAVPEETHALELIDRAEGRASEETAEEPDSIAPGASG